MGRRGDERPPGRFSKSGHTAHRVFVQTDPDHRPPGPNGHGHPDEDAYDNGPSRYDNGARRYDDGPSRRDDGPSRYDDGPPRRDEPQRQPSYDHVRTPYGPPTYHQAPPAAATGQRGVGRAAVGVGRVTNRAARTVTQKVITASKSDGAEESGLTALVWNQVLSYGTDAMVTVALAGTVFFGASSSAQRGNVLLYLLVTVAPFAVVAPVIGPALDRLQHGRRWTMAGTAIGRAILALVMAAHPTDLLVLYPCALGSLVLSKAYGVVRAAAAPRLVPRDMTLTEANSRLTIFGLGSTVVLGGLVGSIIKVTGSYTAGLIVTAVGFAACAFFAFRLPTQVDSAVAAPRHPGEPSRPKRQEKVPTLRRIHGWARRGFEPHLVIALQGESALRLLSGMLTIYLAFYVESTSHGVTGVVELAGVVGGAGAGNFVGTAIGTRVKLARPETVIIIATCAAGAVCLVAALTFTILVAIAAMFLASVANALSKIALDSLIQNDVVEMLRSSAFARSETFLQLAWVLGATLGVAIPSNSTGNGRIAFAVATLVVGGIGTVISLRTRALRRLEAEREPAARPEQADSMAPRSLD